MTVTPRNAMPMLCFKTVINWETGRWPGTLSEFLPSITKVDFKCVLQGEPKFYALLEVLSVLVKHDCHH